MVKCRTYRDPAIVVDGDIPLCQADELETHPAVLAAINAIALERRPGAGDLAGAHRPGM
jgi:hypothetical protein